MFSSSPRKIILLCILSSFIVACTFNENETGNNMEELEEMEEELNLTLEELDNTEEELNSQNEKVNEKEEQVEELNQQLREKEEKIDQLKSMVPEEQVILEKSENIVDLLENKDFETISTYIHPERGVRFSPYAYVNEDEHNQLTVDQIESFMNDSEVYQWGYQDGSGEPIELTPADYYSDYLFIRDFTEAEEINYNELTQRGNTLHNADEVYSDANLIEYFVPASEDELDWASLILAFEEHEDDWVLVGVIIDRWTI
ncbi:hypothetical protein [Evansella tamaricis]|uniref:Uncharacterized protein n=1 Tax=Evansella tamaricis TaxID=2069301 RepID=A0ABS6JK80_9BACI|nr:hypothetical protein [Evansella tamaricis]MBU9713996.1 hypothetical protein [Evansella tamaricis]